MARSVEYVYYLRDFFTRNALGMAAAAKKVAGSTREAAAAVVKFGAVITAAGGYALFNLIGQYSKWEETLAGVHKVLPDGVGGFGNVKNAIRQLSSELPYAREQIAALFDEGIRASVADTTKGAGLFVFELKEFARMAGETGVAFDMSGLGAAKMLAKIKSSLNLTIAEMGSYMQQINLLGDTMSTRERDVLQIVRRVAALSQSGAEAKYLVKSREAVAALGASMSAAGVNAQSASTGIRNFMLRAGTGRFGSKETLKAFEWAQLDPDHVAGVLKNDVLAGTDMVLVAIKKIKDSAKRNAALKGIFGLRGVDAFGPLLANIGLLKQARDITADTARREERWNKTMRVKFATITTHVKMMNNSLSYLRDGFVSSWSAEIIWVTDKIRKMADALNEMPTFKKFAGGFIAAMFVVGSLLIVLGLIAMSLSALGVTAAGVGAVLGLIFSPIGLVFAGLALGAYLVISYMEQIKAVVRAIGNFIWSVMTGIFSAIATVLGSIASFMRPVTSLIGAAVSIAAIGTLSFGILYGAVKVVLTILGSMVGTMAGVLAFYTLFGVAAYLIINNWQSVKSWFSGFLSYIGQIFGGIGHIIVGAFSFDWGQMKSGFKMLFDGLLNTAKHLGAGIYETLRAAFSLVGIELPGLDVIKQMLADISSWFSQTFSFKIDWPEMPGWMKNVGNWFSSAEKPGPVAATSTPYVRASDRITQSMAKRVKIENKVRSEVHVTSDVKLTAPSSIAVTVNGQIGGHIPLGTNATRGQNMATSTTGQTVNE